MEQIVLKGVTYTKASKVAKKFGYTSDYIGQLCRKEKVGCELVGRTWFVDEVSLQEHKQQRYKKSPKKSTRGEARSVAVQKNSSDEKISKGNIKLKHDDKKYRIAVHAREHKAVMHAKRQNHNFTNRVTWSAPVYEPDQGELLPSLIKAVSPRAEGVVKLAVNPAEAKKVEIKEEGAHQSFAPTELPKIPLNGTLRIKSYDEKTETAEVENTSKNKAFPQSQVQLQNRKGVIAMTRQSAVNQFTPKLVLEKRESVVFNRAAVMAQHAPEMPRNIHSEAFPQLSESDQLEQAELLNELSAQQPKSRSMLLVFVGVLLLAVVASYVVLNLESSTIATSQQTVDTISIDTAPLQNLLNN